MQLATIIDLLVLIAIIGRAVAGFRTGLLAGALGLAGIVGGALAGIWAGPRLVEFFPLLDASRLARTLTLVCVVVALSIVGDLLAQLIVNRIRRGKKPHGFDAVLGGLTSAVAAAFLCWFVMAAVRPFAPAALGTGIENSLSYQVLNEAVPEQFDRLPDRRPTCSSPNCRRSSVVTNRPCRFPNPTAMRSTVPALRPRRPASSRSIRTPRIAAATRPAAAGWSRPSASSPTPTW